MAGVARDDIVSVGAAPTTMKELHNFTEYITGVCWTGEDYKLVASNQTYARSCSNIHYHPLFF